MGLLDTPISFVILITIVLFSLMGFSSPQTFLLKFSLNPYSIVYHRSYYQMITHIFVHLDVIHLLFNSLTFFFFAPQLESAVNSTFFLLLFFTSGIISAIPTIIKNRHNSRYYSLGASGAIAGIVFSYILFYPTSRIYIFMLPIGIPAPIFAMIYLGYCIYASKYHSSNINHEAHFWGAIWGLIFTIIYYPQIIQFYFKLLEFI